jgi:hypothetical protein
MTKREPRSADAWRPSSRRPSATIAGDDGYLDKLAQRLDQLLDEGGDESVPAKPTSGAQR